MNTEILHKELEFNAVRSGGPGGQHANKVSSKIILSFHIDSSKAFSENEKDTLSKNLQKRLTKENILILTCDERRSQHQNKTIVTKRFFNIIEQALQTRKKRIVTKPSSVSKVKRLEKKKKLAYKKALRRKPKIE